VYDNLIGRFCFKLYRSDFHFLRIPVLQVEQKVSFSSMTAPQCGHVDVATARGNTIAAIL